jgi:hypothetical protein
MKLKVSKNANVNYLSKIVEIKEFIKHPDPKVERIKCAVVDGFIITVGIDSEPGLYVYFPVLSQINAQLLQYLNLYRNKTLNDQMNQLYKEFKGKGRSMAFSDYAWRGGFREFAADAFAHAKALQKAYKEGRVKGGGSFATSNSLPVRVFRVMKNYK